MKTSYSLIILLLFIGMLCSQVNDRGRVMAAGQAQDGQDITAVTQPADVQPESRVQDILEEFVNNRDLQTANVSFYAINLETGEILADHDSRKSLSPASTMKVVTTATALMLKGPDHRFVTKVGYDGNLQPDGTLTGNVVITAGGDPSLGSRYFYGDRTAFLEEWATSLKNAGIQRVEGSVVADISIFRPAMPQTWIWGDMGTHYGAHAHPLSIYDNEFSVSFTTGEPGEQPVVTAMVPEIPGLTFRMDVVPGGEGEHAVLSGSPNQVERIITGTLPPNYKNFSLQGSIPNPEILVAELLKDKLAKAGITVSGTSRLSHDPVPSTAVDSVVSPRLLDIITKTNVKSINTYAETLFLHTALWQGRYPEPVTAGKNIVRYWGNKGLDVNGMFVDDGSGLSRSNGVSARHLVGILQQVYNSGYCEEYITTLPVAGRSGSLTSIGVGTRAANNMAAKSGYITRVRSYAGYVKNRNNETLAFAILVNNYTTSPYAVKRHMEKVMVCLADV